MHFSTLHVALLFDSCFNGTWSSRSQYGKNGGHGLVLGIFTPDLESIKIVRNICHSPQQMATSNYKQEWLVEVVGLSDAVRAAAWDTPWRNPRHGAEQDLWKVLAHSLVCQGRDDDLPAILVCIHCSSRAGQLCQNARHLECLCKQASPFNIQKCRLQYQWRPSSGVLWK